MLNGGCSEHDGRPGELVTARPAPGHGAAERHADGRVHEHVQQFGFIPHSKAKGPLQGYGVNYKKR